MFEKAYLLYALTSAVLYAIAASSLKSASDRGARTLQTTLLANIGTTLAFMVFVPWGEEGVFPAVWWPAVIVGLLFAAGQWMSVLALSRGHASIATPAMGSKVVLVALISVAFGRQLGLNVWIACFLTSVGLAVLAFSPRKESFAGGGSTVFFAILAAAAFGCFDVLTARWSPWLTFGRLLPWSMVIGAAASAIPVLILDRKRPTLSHGAVPFMLLGVGLMVIQSQILIWSIGKYHDAAGSNVVYGSRGVWSVLLVWIFGHHFSKQERMTSPGMLFQRLGGALLIGAAVLLVFWPF